MIYWLHRFIEENGIATIIAATVAGLMSLLVSRRTIYINSVTVQRSTWIEKLRLNLAELAALCAFHHYKICTDNSYSKSKEHEEALRKFENLTAVIRLQLNPMGRIDGNIIEIAITLEELAERGADDFSIHSAQWLLIRHSQWLLKEEWETVKMEASGWMQRPWLFYKRHKRRRAYKSFCQLDGKLTILEG